VQQVVRALGDRHRQQLWAARPPPTELRKLG
jgi:hypothetical protein